MALDLARCQPAAGNSSDAPSILGLDPKPVIVKGSFVNLLLDDGTKGVGQVRNIINAQGVQICSLFLLDEHGAVTKEKAVAKLADVTLHV